MLVDRMAEKIAQGEPALGCRTADPHMVELMAHIGFDWVWFDQMFTSNDWQKTEVLLRTAEACGITPLLRIHTNPWFGYDHRVAAEASRAFGVGAKYVMVSHSGMKEIDECLQVARDWHSPLHIHPFSSIEEWNPASGHGRAERNIVPQAESAEALRTFAEAMSRPDIRYFFFAMTDASRELGGSEAPDWHAPALWDMVKRCVANADAVGVTVGANTSYAYNLDEMGRRIRKLHEAGVKLIMAQSAYFLFQVGIGNFLRDLKSEFAES